jgi:hypothetical protein
MTTASERAAEGEVTESQTDLERDAQSLPDGAGGGPGRDFEARFGTAIVSRGIATFPALILRWQKALGLDDGEVITLAYILSYYRKQNDWPSVSIDAIADARGVDRSVVEREIRQLDAEGLVRKGGIDRRYRTFFWDLSGLFERLLKFAAVEEQLAALNAERARIRSSALGPMEPADQGKHAVQHNPTRPPSPEHRLNRKTGIKEEDVEASSRGLHRRTEGRERASASKGGLQHGDKPRSAEPQPSNAEGTIARPSGEGRHSSGTPISDLAVTGLGGPATADILGAADPAVPGDAPA